MVNIRGLSSRLASIALGGVIIVTCSGVIHSMGEKGLEMYNGKKAMRDTADINAIIYSSEYDLYDRYINLIKKEIIDTNMHNNVIDVYAAYLVMQDKGLISLGDDFETITPDYDLVGNLGMSIISGKGVCRNQAYNLYRIFDALGYDASVSCGESYSTNFTNGTNNHAVTVVNDNGKYYLFDPTNNTIYLRSICGQFKSIDDSNKKYYPNPYGDEMFSELKDNAPLYVYMNDDYKNRDSIRANRDASIRKALDNISYYKSFENMHLLDIEKEIEDSIKDKVDNVSSLVKVR